MANNDVFSRRSGLLGAYGRLQTAEPFTIFRSTLTGGVNFGFWETITSGAGAYSNLLNQSAGQLSVSGSGDVVIREQHGYNHHLAGKGMTIVFGALFGSPATGVTKRAGYLNDDNGLYVEQDQTGFFLVRRSKASGSVVNERIPQANWSIDRMDGRGPSGIVLDPTKFQTFVIVFSWLGAGRALFGIDAEEGFWPVHEILPGNVLTEAFLGSPHLPIRYEVRSTSAAGTLIQGGCSVMSNGGLTGFGGLTGVSSGTTQKSLGPGVRQSILSVRMKQFLASGEPNRRIAIPTSVFVTTSKTLLVELVIQHIVEGTPVFGGSPTWLDAGVASALELARDVTTVTGGHIVQNGFVTGGTGQASNLAELLIRSAIDPPIILARNSANNGTDVLHLVATNIEGISASVSASLDFRERF